MKSFSFSPPRADTYMARFIGAALRWNFKYLFLKGLGYKGGRRLLKAATPNFLDEGKEGWCVAMSLVRRDTLRAIHTPQ
jgi:hypothetical protein